MKRGVAAMAAVGLLLLLLNSAGNRPRPRAAPRRPPGDDDVSGKDLPSKANYGSVERGLESALWGTPGPALRPCWSDQLPKKIGKTWGFVVVTISNGPQNHRAQIADAVVVASQLGASLVVPIVKEAQKEPHSRFEDIYDLKTFIAKLDGIVRVVGRSPDVKDMANATVTKIPHKVTREYIDENVRPVFKRQNGVVLLGASIPTLKDGKEDRGMEAVRCLVMHQALQFVSLVQRVGDRIVSRMREAAPKPSNRRFVAVDLQAGSQRHKACNVTGARKRRCLEPQEIGHVLRMVGYPSDTAIYLSQSRWDTSLDSLATMFPNVHTKDYSLPFNEENQYVFSGRTQFEQAIDLYICSRSNVFMPTVPGAFYTHIAGERIPAGLHHILLPAVKGAPGSSKVDFASEISPYVKKKNHPVYSCYCDSSLGPTQ